MNTSLKIKASRGGEGVGQTYPALVSIIPTEPHLLDYRKLTVISKIIIYKVFEKKWYYGIRELCTALSTGCLIGLENLVPGVHLGRQIGYAFQIFKTLLPSID